MSQKIKLFKSLHQNDEQRPTARTNTPGKEIVKMLLQRLAAVLHREKTKRKTSEQPGGMRGGGGQRLPARKSTSAGIDGWAGKEERVHGLPDASSQQLPSVVHHVSQRRQAGRLCDANHTPQSHGDYSPRLFILFLRSGP
jgi:hypothetical protein